MAWHNRFISSIQSTATGSNLRLNIKFRRPDLLWTSPYPLTNPLTGEMLSLPLQLTDTVVVGPNILDVIKREAVEVWEETEVSTPDGSLQTFKTKVEKQVWQLRHPDEFFPQQDSDFSEDHPLRKSLCSGGTIVDNAGEFVRVEKLSSCSINTLVYKLAIGMTGSETAASRRIGDMAATAWEHDLTRALQLYQLISHAPDHAIADELVPNHLKAGASVGQIVETALLREACNWLGIDPDSPIQRQRGRPRKRNAAGDATSAGQVIELTLQPDGSITGRLIVDYQGLPKDTNLASLTLTKLAAILVALREAPLVDDADLLEAYLDAVDPDWKAKIAEEISVESGAATTNPWEVLGLSPGASLDDVKQAYKRIMRVVHPDTSSLPRWYAQTVNHAYQQLLEELDHDQ